MRGSEEFGIGSVPIHPFDRAKPAFEAGKEAWLRVNLEQAPAFRAGSRKVHSFLSLSIAEVVSQYTETNSWERGGAVGWKRFGAGTFRRSYSDVPSV